MALLRLGDDIDDYCVRCKRVTNHSIVSMVNTEPAKMRCRTCYSEHDYRHAEAPPPKKDLRKSALFNEVLASVDPKAAEDQAPDPQAAKKTTRKH
jgi:recombinational DNA repair protein (RecF pathway)